jgi:hypothetical protein
VIELLDWFAASGDRVVALFAFVIVVGWATSMARGGR